MTEEITHCITGKARYNMLETWPDDGVGVDHDVEHWADDRDVHRVVFDVETNAEIPQRPIFAVAYDELAGKLYIANHRHPVIEAGTQKMITEAVTEEFEDMGYTVNEVDYSPDLGVTWFGRILDAIKVFNEQHGDKKKQLCAHNAFFDLGILGHEDDELLGKAFDEDDTDGVISYNDWSVGHRRAGAHGRIYDFRHQLQDEHIGVYDTMVAAQAVWKPAGLEALCDAYGIEYHEDDDQEHGEITEQYVRYCANDVAATLKASYALDKTLQDDFGRRNIDGSDLYSSASIAKAMLRDLGYNRSHYTEDAISIAAASYFGGQTEALDTGREIENVAYTDILSQYPTAVALTDVWRFMRAEVVEAERVDVEDVPTEIGLDELNDAVAWREIADYYVAVESDGAELPVRAQLSNVETTRVYKSQLETAYGEQIIYHLADVIGAQISGDADDITITDAWKMQVNGTQDITGTTTLGGTEVSGEDNLMKRGIEERKRVQIEVNDGDKDDRTLALKVVSNSLYGVSAERIVETLHGGGKVDNAGTYYNPHVAATATASGRLMLTIGEAVAERDDGELYYCDTDSLIIDSHVAEPVIEYFEDLNPYSGVAGDLDFLEYEDADRLFPCDEHGFADFGGEDGECDECDSEEILLSDCNLFAVGVKKYCIIDRETRQIVMNKEHGLGHYKQLRGSNGVAFWRTLCDRFGIETTGPRLSEDLMESPVWWAEAASTALVRQRMEDLHDYPVRYGDFLKRSITLTGSGRELQYVGLGDQLIEIEHTDRRPDFDDTGETVSTGTMKLSDAEKEYLYRKTSFDWQQHGFTAMSVKAALIHAGAGEWLDHYTPGMDKSDALRHFQNSGEQTALTGAPTASRRTDTETVRTAEQQANDRERAERRALKAAVNGEQDAIDALVEQFDWHRDYAETAPEYGSASEAWNDVRTPALTAKRVREVAGFENLSAVKTVSDVLQDWWLSALASASDDGRPDVHVTGKRIVTKEASDVPDAWNKRLNATLNELTGVSVDTGEDDGLPGGSVYDPVKEFEDDGENE